MSFLHTGQGTEYLCAIKDMYDKSIISYNLSAFNDNPLVFETLNRAFSAIPTRLREGLIIYSDQGNQFLSPAYAAILYAEKAKHSVSAKGSCVDNVPIESWFSALKTECIYLKDFSTRSEIQRALPTILLITINIDIKNN